MTLFAIPPEIRLFHNFIHHHDYMHYFPPWLVKTVKLNHGIYHYKKDEIIKIIGMDFTGTCWMTKERNRIRMIDENIIFEFLT